MIKYDKLNLDKQKDLRYINYYSFLLNSLCSMFVWECPDDVNPYWMERFLHESGSLSAKYMDNGTCKIAQMPSRAGDLDQFGDGTIITGTYIGGSYTGKVFDEVGICYNNVVRMPDFDMDIYANMFANVDKAIMSTINWSIVAPLICAKNGKTKKALDLILDDVLNGKTKSIISEDIVEAMRGKSDGASVYTIDITKPEMIQNVQYESELYDVLLRRFFNKFGLNIQNSSKHAQASVDEVHGMDSVSWVLVTDMLNQRQAFVDQMNKLGDFKWSVRFSDIWQMEYDRFLNDAKKYLVENQKAEMEIESINLDNLIKAKALTEPQDETVENDVEKDVETVETEEEKEDDDDDKTGDD